MQAIIAFVAVNAASGQQADGGSRAGDTLLRQVRKFRVPPPPRLTVLP
jgi:hypothetical protein